ncbi:MAG: polyprenyl synthetase family protein, partial [Candidatus Methanofastidiosia archaeon]
MDFSDELSELKEEIEAEILKFMDEVFEDMQIEELPRVHFKILKDFYSDIKDHLLFGGKRLRPACMVMAFCGFSEKNDLILRASLSCEFVHSASLILDDAMDEDVLRHGRETFNAIYAHKFLESLNFDMEKYRKGESWISKESLLEISNLQRSISRYSYALSSLASNLMFSMSERALTESGFEKGKILRALRLHREMYKMLNEGQLLDVFMESKSPTEKEYLSMIDKKTGLLYAYPIKIGGMLADYPDFERLDKYSFAMARAFQIHDDILGSFGREEETGKPADSDIRGGKRTLLVIEALERANSSQKELLKS